jgi:transposase
MPGKAAKVTITVRQKVILEEFSRSRSEGKMIAQRAAIVLQAFDGCLNEDISAKVGLERKQVGVWRRRWQDAWESLTCLECREPRRLREAIRDTLRDSPRPGAPGTFTAEQIAEILAVACEPPEKSGRPITHWTHRELWKEVRKRGIVEEISLSRIGHFLREAALQPHRRKMWLNTTEKDPDLFQRQVETVCKTYQAAPLVREREGTHTVSCDEMTGIQALERTAPAKPVLPDQVAREEFEYVRHGTTTLIGSFDVVTGQMCHATLGPTRTESDFISHIEQTVAADPDASWVFIVDTLNIHWSAGLVEWVAERCEPNRPLGKKGEGRDPEMSGDTSRILVRRIAPHPLRFLAQAQLVAEPDRDPVWHRYAEGSPERELSVSR